MSNVELAKRVFGRLNDEFSERNHSVYYDLLADDVVVEYGTCREGMPLSEPHVGKASAIEFSEEVSPSVVEGHRLDDEPFFIDDGDRVVVLGRESYVIKKTGAKVQNRPYAVVLTFRDGKIVRMLQIKDLSEFADAYPKPAASATG